MNNIAIYDPICLDNNGHNARSCRLFARAARDFYDHVKILCAADGYEQSGSLFGDIDSEGWLTCGYDLKGTGGHQKDNYYLSAALTDLKKSLEENPDYRIFAPGIDFYTFSALCTLAKSEPELVRDRVSIRFIGVLENDTRRTHNKGRFFAKFAEEAASLNDLGVRFSAETMFYANFLSNLTNVNVETCPYPVVPTLKRGSYSRAKTGDMISVGLIGAPRREKGYFAMASLADRLFERKLDVELVVQRMPISNGEFLANYSMHLHAMPNVRSLASFLQDDEMELALHNCDYQLLAYLSSIYKYRGSAMLFDAVQHFCPVIVQKDNGFALEVSEFKIGYVYDDESELVKVLSEIGPPTEAMIDNLIAFQTWSQSQVKACMAEI